MSLVREAVALEAGTLVLAVGGRPGVAFAPSMWEDKFVTRGVRDRCRESQQAAIAEACEITFGCCHRLAQRRTLA
jgi:hypothetical protein